MVTLQYYDEIEKAVKIPSAITDFFASSDAASNEENLFYSFMLEVGLPVEKWIFYVVTHEEEAFKRYFDCKPNENDRRLSPKELFYCLRPLSDENRRSILGKLSNISDGVINKLSKYVEEDNFVEFSNVINETDINTSSITTICMNVNALIDYNYAMEQFYLNIDQIVQIDNEVEALRQMEKVFNVFLSNIERFIDDEKATDNFVNQVNNLFEVLSRNENVSKVASNLTIRNYHYCLWFYHHIQYIDFATRVPLDCLEELVFNPKYEKFWKDYEDDTCLEELDKEMESYLGFSVREDEGEQGVLIASGWPLPDDFFGPAYIDDDCPLDEYFPEFLQFDKQNDPITNLSKEGVKKLSDLFSKFINKLASKGYIQNNNDIKLALAHALTGRRVITTVKKVEWKKPMIVSTPLDHQNSISYLIRTLYPRTIKSLGKNNSKYSHILTVFDGLKNTAPGSNVAENVQRSPIRKIVDDFLEAVERIKIKEKKDAPKQ